MTHKKGFQSLRSLQPFLSTPPVSKAAWFPRCYGREYEAKAFIAVLDDVGSRISRSHSGCPWENGYQESFYDKFKVDFADPSRFKTFGELVAEVYRTIWTYNHTRIHSALKMPPHMFAEKIAA